MQKKAIKVLCIVMTGTLAIWGPEEVHAAASAGRPGQGGNVGTATISGNALDSGTGMAEDKAGEPPKLGAPDRLQDGRDSAEDRPLGENTPEGEETPMGEETPTGEETSTEEETTAGGEIPTDGKTSAEDGSDSQAPDADEDGGKDLPGESGKVPEGSIAFRGKELSAKAGREYYLPLEGKGLRSFTGITFRLTYDPDILTLVDFAAQLPGRQAKAGAAGEELEILALEKGEITFACNKQIPEDREWSGLITMLLFKATADGETSIRVAAEEEGAEAAETPEAETKVPEDETENPEAETEAPEDKTETPEDKATGLTH